MKINEKRKKLRFISYFCAMFFNEATEEFIRANADGDVWKLALQGTKDAEVGLTQALQQIAGRQMARKKLPTWAAVDGIVYPPHLNMEQCSSEQTARYKAKLAKCQGSNCKLFVDLTGGFGIDFYWMSQAFQERIYVEQNPELCTIAEHNLRLLGLASTVVNGTAADYLSQLDHASVIFLDPARRNEHGGRTYGIEDCTPNVLELLPMLLGKSDTVILKLSPMLDWRKAVSDLRYVREVHIVSLDNECKELIIQMKKETQGGVRLVCVNLLSNGEKQVFESFEGQSPNTNHISPLSPSPLLPSLFLYEPNASIMKAGCFAALAERYAVRQVANSSHLFLSTEEIDGFPGRKFRVLAVSPADRKKLCEVLVKSGLPIERANMSVRNFPMTPEQLRKKLKLKDGGDTYIFATTTADGQHILYICRKIS